MTDAIPRIVEGIVTRHAPFGAFVDISEDRDGLVVITAFHDDPYLPNPDLPEVGAAVRAVLLGYTNGQPRLSMRPADFASVET